MDKKVDEIRRLTIPGKGLVLVVKAQEGLKIGDVVISHGRYEVVGIERSGWPDGSFKEHFDMQPVGLVVREKEAMTITDLIHIFYKAFGADSGRLVEFSTSGIGVRIGEKNYAIGKDLDCWQNAGHGPSRGPDEKKISAKLMRTQADWLDPKGVAES